MCTIHFCAKCFRLTSKWENVFPLQLFPPEWCGWYFKIGFYSKENQKNESFIENWHKCNLGLRNWTVYGFNRIWSQERLRKELRQTNRVFKIKKCLHCLPLKCAKHRNICANTNIIQKVFALQTVYTWICSQLGPQINGGEFPLKKPETI